LRRWVAALENHPLVIEFIIPIAEQLEEEDSEARES
jgi:hypothetical protein